MRWTWLVWFLRVPVCFIITQLSSGDLILNSPSFIHLETIWSDPNQPLLLKLEGRKVRNVNMKKYGEGETGRKGGKRTKSRRKNTIRGGRVLRTVALENFQIINPYNKAIISNNTICEYTFLHACISLAHYNKQITIPSIWERIVF